MTNLKNNNMNIINKGVEMISIEGNIGSGKTKLLEKLKKHYIGNKNIIFLDEPTEDWKTITDESDITILEKFYSNKKKYSFSFQMMAYISRLAILKEAIKNNPNSIVITERSLFTDKCVFAKMLYDSNNIELINYKIYLKWFDVFSLEYPIHKIIYVDTVPEICHTRIIKRNRTGENNITLKYLNDCDTYHSAMLDKSLHDCVCKDQLIINGNIDISENECEMDEWIRNINKFIFR